MCFSMGSQQTSLLAEAKPVLLPNMFQQSHFHLHKHVCNSLSVPVGTGRKGGKCLEALTTILTKGTEGFVEVKLRSASSPHFFEETCSLVEQPCVQLANISVFACDHPTISYGCGRERIEKEASPCLWPTHHCLMPADG